MLQIVKIIPLVILLCLSINAQSNSSASIEWLLEGAFEDEHMYTSEANYVLPSEISDALTLYKNGQYRKCIQILEKIRKLNLPDNRLDFVAFVLGEAYRQLKLKENARQQYEFITQYFPQSDKIPASLFRIMEFASEKQDADVVDSVYQTFRKRYLKHPLYNSVVYTYGKLLYKMNRFEDASLMLEQVGKNSSRYLHAQFITAMCYFHSKNYQKALIVLDYIRKNSQSEEITSEATNIIGDINYSQNNLKSALECYRSIPERSSRYKYSIVKAAKVELDLGNYQNAKEIARLFLKKNKSGENYFEMASVLEQAYTKLGDDHNASKVEGLIQQQIVNGRLAFEIFQEIDRLVDLSKNWQLLEYEAIRGQNQSLMQSSQSAKRKIKDLDNKLNTLLNYLEPNDNQKSNNSVPHLAERRYLALLKKQMSIVEDSINRYNGTINKSSSILKRGSDTYQEEKMTTDDKLGVLQRDYQKINNEYSLVLSECLGGESERKQADEEMQTKYVDWAFMKYQDKKEMLKKMAEEIASQKKNKHDSSQTGKALTSALTQMNYDKIVKTIVDERNRLIDHIEMMQEIYKKNSYNPQILFRLAELYFDKSGDEFNAKLRDYERQMAESKDSTKLIFPEYDLSKVIEMYNEIISQYPKNDLSDDALYFKAMALQKEGKEDSANEVLSQLVEIYPESEFFVEANMNIGKYFFERPKINNNSGYKLAEEAYRKVLFYRDHPEFVQALYHLGWCYYMQDKYDEAIAVFKYLVEEAKLDFDATKMEEKQIVNPLLRGEAIDYIAISFDEEKKVDEVLKFLQLIGNDDYSALVLKRIAELREEDLDYSSAIKMYQRLITQFPKSISAPDASIGIIKLYESHDKADSAMIERKKFFKTYANGSEWHKETAKRDTILLHKIDSIAIAMGLYVADANYRKAELSKNYDEYHEAANNYNEIVEKYSNLPNASEALWNLAVILETKLYDKPMAYNEYRKFSLLTHADSSRREQAALNAIAIAQSLLPADSLSAKGNLDFSAEKVVEAVNNYLTLFPNGSSCNKVLLGLGAIYFNRQMYGKAKDVYNKIVSKGPAEKEYYEALLFIAQCHFGEEKWQPAIAAFEKVYKESADQVQRGIAFKFLLQSEFLFAKSYLANANYEMAAEAFKNIEIKYPGSEYGDIVLFNAAEALEKKELWLKACESYYDLVKKYPASKYSPDALYNAAENYEKIEKFEKAAETYEQLVNDYGMSEKAKDALFNLGLCYEKLGKFDEMAQVNERYSALYPGEKDVETMLLRSAAYYAKTAMYDKAINVYRNFIRRFPNSPKSIESMFMIAKCSLDQGDKENALIGFNQTEQQNMKFAQEGGETNNYYASEAAYHTAMINREKFLEVKLILPDDVLKRAIKEKSDLLNEAAKAFQRVIQYQSERMFEAAFRVGQLYEDLSDAYKNQERPKLDPINAAVLEKDILTLSSQLLQKSFIPYAKAMEMAKGFDSLGTDQKMWIVKSKDNYASNCLKAGQMLFNSIAAMNDAPIPKEIQEKPLHYYQYIKQLLETLAPLKIKVVDYYSNALDSLDSLKLSETTSAMECSNQFVYVNYLIGDGYDHLAALILKRSQDIAKTLSGQEKEDLLFQLEDLVYELQDKSIVEYEDGLRRIEKKQLSANPWYTKIIECLARLSPDKYGASFYKTDLFTSGTNWIVRSDSVANWNSLNPPKDGWNATVKVPGVSVPAKVNDGSLMWANNENKHLFFWKHVFLNGTPRNANVFINTKYKYNLYLNGSLTLKDTIGQRDINKVDSATGIVALTKGGDNVVAVEVTVDSTHASGVGLVFSVLIDTTQHFTSGVELPDAMVAINKSKQMVEQKNKNGGSEKTAAVSVISKPDSISYSTKYQNKNELLKAIEDYKKKEFETNNLIIKEIDAIDKMKDKRTAITNKILLIDQEIKTLRAEKKVDSKDK